MDKNSASEWAMVGVPTGVLSVVGYVGHMLAYSTKKISPRNLVGGMLVAGFTGWVAYSILAHSGLHPEYAGPIAAMLGASGDRGFGVLYKFARSQFGGQ